MGVSSSFVFRERNSSQSMKFVDDDEITMLNDWEVIEDDLEDDEEPTKKFDEMFTTRLPSSEKYIRPSLSEGLSYLGDLKSKSDYVLQDEKITTAFVRYLFQGMWIPELLQIPVVSSPASSPTHSATQPIFPEYKFDGVFLSSCVDDDSWKPLLKSLDALCGNPSSAAVLASENPLIAIVDKVCVKRGDSAFLLTLAVAMQAFCRSEVFLQLSEQQWSPEAFRSIVWTDYARVGRAVVVQHYQQQLLHTEAEGGDVTRGHIALLDALYVHLMTTSSQRDTLDYLRPASDENASHWLQDLQAVMLSLPVNWAVYETKASNAASLPKEDSTPTVFACQQQSGLLKSLLSWQCLFHTGSKHAPANQGCSSPPPTPLIVPIHCYAASTAQSILRRLHTTTAATQLAFPVLTTDASPEAHLCFECIQPILRCPLLAFDRDGNLSEVTTGYRWDVHRAVAAQVNVNFTSALPLVLAQDVAFLLSHIIG